MAKDLASLVDPSEIVKVLGRYLPQRAIAEGARVSERTVRTWSKKSVPVREGNYVSLTAVRDVVAELQDSLTETGVRQWMLARNRILDGKTPIEVLREGHPEAVLRAAKAYGEGVYL